MQYAFLEWTWFTEIVDFFGLNSSFFWALRFLESTDETTSKQQYLNQSGSITQKCCKVILHKYLVSFVFIIIF